MVGCISDRPVWPDITACWFCAEFGGDIDNQAILDFVDSGKNLLVAASPDASDSIRSLALECGVELDEQGAAVYDHFSHQAANGAHDPTLVATSAVVDSEAVFAGKQLKVQGRHDCTSNWIMQHNEVDHANSYLAVYNA